jgi:hypothetical protein
VELDGAGAEEYRAAYFGVCPPLRDEQGDLQFLWRQPLAAWAALADGLSAGVQFGPGPVRPWPRVEPVEDLDRGPELDACVTAPLCPAQALAVAQQGAGVLKDVPPPFLEVDGLLEVSVVPFCGHDPLAPRGPGGWQRVGVAWHQRQELR